MLSKTISKDLVNWGTTRRYGAWRTERIWTTSYRDADAERRNKEGRNLDRVGTEEPYTTRNYLETRYQTKNLYLLFVWTSRSSASV